MVYLFGMPDGSDMDKRWGRLVTGEVVLDGKQQLAVGKPICSTSVLRSPGNLVHTRTGDVYSLFGEGETLELPATVLSRIQSLESPQAIAAEIGESWKSQNHPV